MYYTTVRYCRLIMRLDDRGTRERLPPPPPSLLAVSRSRRLTIVHPPPTTGRASCPDCGRRWATPATRRSRPGTGPRQRRPRARRRRHDSATTYATAPASCRPSNATAACSPRSDRRPCSHGTPGRATRVCLSPSVAVATA